MADAVKRFQARHGLKIDGMVGPNTLKELNVSAGERQKQIIINLERLRWLPRNLGARHIRVNIAAFTLDAIRKKEKKVSMRVIVGKAYNETPLFSKKIGYIEFNPYWNVPRSIAVEELLPKIKSDAGYITNNHYELVAGWAPESPVLNSDYIDWKSVDETNFPGRIRQLPGPWNTMGRVKIMFPNSYDVYLHDTPSKYLFQRVDRALSHGCIRAEKPIDLAVFLLSDNPKWSRKRIEAIIKSGNHHAVPITSQCTIHLLYHTAWVDNEQKINYRRDIYGRDRILWEALQKELSYDSIPKAVVTMVP
jgi:murein L,D-transpeptidase YcbB/YkuD